MEELFGVSMDLIMWVLLAIFSIAMAVVAFMALRNRIMVKLGLRNIPKRWTQTVLIVIGIMLSSVIMAAAFGTGDTINFSIRNQAVEVLGPIDEIIFSARATSEDSFGTRSYFPIERFRQLQEELAGVESIDGLTPGIGETVAAINLRTALSEGSTRVAGVDPTSLQGFGTLTLTSGGEARVEDLAEDQAYINAKGAEEMDARVGDEIRLFLGEGTLSFRVKEVVNRGGLAGDSSTLVIPLERAQRIFGRVGQINSIAVSNLGNELEGADVSEEVTRTLRVLFGDKEVAGRLKALLNQERVLQALQERGESLRDSLQTDLIQLREELQQGETSDRLVSLLSDDDIEEEVLKALETDDLKMVEREAITLFADLREFRVLDIKRIVLEEADEVASGVTTFFIVLGLFSIMVGVLLIFLIFVMLAAARRSEMGMARAVGAKRSHLVQMFLFEGTTYALASAAVGVVIGLGVSVLIVLAANRFIGTFEEDFQFTPHFTARSAIVAYCLGMVITLGTVAFSAYRVSRMNIVAAVRGLPEPIARYQQPWWKIVGTATIRPFIFEWRALQALYRPLQVSRFLGYNFLAVIWLVLFIWLIDIAVVIIRVVLRFGWPALPLGLLITWWGTTSEEAALFRIGITLMIIGLGLTIRTILQRSSLRPDVRDRIAYTFIGVVNLIFWMLPFDTLRAVAGDLEGGPEMFFISGISMVAAAVWTVMYNSDLLLRALTFLTGRIGYMRPVLMTAVAYPMSAKFRTGLTLAMFALVIFTLIVVSILTEAFSSSSGRIAIATGGWDIEGIQNVNTPIMDIRQAIDEAPALRRSDFEAIGGYTLIPIEARQVGGEEQRWRFYAVRAADDDFLESTGHQLKLIADGYGSDRDVWEALRNDPSLAVVDALVVHSRSGFTDSEIPFQLEGLHYEDDDMEPIEIEVREPRTGAVVPLTVIGVLDLQTDNFGNIGFGMFTSKAKLDDALPFPVPITNYRFRVAQGVDVAQASRSLEALFPKNGLETEVLKELVEEQAAANRAFNNLFTGYMAMGLLVGIAALGVISLRAVVERRQQIGVLRAIGYRRRMIQLSFLLESSFVALLGIAIGVGLGIILSYNLVNDIRDDIETIQFKIPWMQITAIVLVAYLFSLLTTFLPARQASRIYPAEALR